jgi:hypothetical protein
MLEAIFTIIAGSHPMFEDAEAMSVGSVTYLFNLWDKIIKHRPYIEEELGMPQAV